MSRSFWLKVAFVLLYAMVAYFVTLSIMVSEILVVPAVIVDSMALGVATQTIYDRRVERPIARVYSLSLVVYLTVSLFFVAAAQETIFCVAIAFPIVIVGSGLGIFLTRAVFQRIDSTRTLALSFLVFPLFLAPPVVERMAHPQIETVSTTVEIDAAPEDIWPMLRSLDTIRPHERPWTLTHNIFQVPRPLRSTTDQGIRYAFWTDGVRFEEPILEEEFARLLRWRFEFPDPSALEAIDYRILPDGPDVEMLEGQYRLTLLPDGTTRLDLTTTFSLNTPINWYLAPWGRMTMRDFHIGVLTVVKSRAEAD